MKGVAIKKGQTREKIAGYMEMGTLRCDGCGEEFLIGHDPAFSDKRVAMPSPTSGTTDRRWIYTSSTTSV
jgi:hypothetical protein